MLFSTPSLKGEKTTIGTLLGNCRYLGEDEALLEEIEIVAESSFNSPKNTRTKEEVYEHTYFGLICEQFYINLDESYTKYENPGEDPDDDFIYDIDGPYFDIFKRKLRVEIKSSTKDTSWWNISQTNEGNCTYNFFLDNAKENKIDIIVHLYMDDNYDVYLTHVAQADTFERYMENSSGKGWYYQHEWAEKNGHCVLYKLPIKDKIAK